MAKLILFLVFYAALVFSGCAALDDLFTPGPSGKSPAGETGEKFRGLYPPWSEVALMGLMAIQNIYLGARKVQTRRKKLVAVKAAP